jgi:hypothetical protein
MVKQLVGPHIGSGRRGYARYAPGQDARKLISAGQGHTQHPLLAVCAGSNPAGGTGRDVNSNALTIVGRLGASPVTCGNADAFSICRSARATSRPAANVLLSGIH